MLSTSSEQKITIALLSECRLVLMDYFDSTPSVQCVSYRRLRVAAKLSGVLPGRAKLTWQSAKINKTKMDGILKGIYEQYKNGQMEESPLTERR
jgi:hypothetical protein